MPHPHKIYQVVSPYWKQIMVNLGFSSGKCRHSPTCSLYAKTAVSRHGIIIGSWLSLKRLLKCHPWSRGGYDPVPE